MPQADSSHTNAGSTSSSTAGGVAPLGRGCLALSRQSATDDHDTTEAQQSTSTGCRQRPSSESQSARRTGAQVTAASGEDQMHPCSSESMGRQSRPGTEGRGRQPYFARSSAYGHSWVPKPAEGYSGTYAAMANIHDYIRLFNLLEGIETSASGGRLIDRSAEIIHPELRGKRIEDVTEAVREEKSE